MSIVEDFYNKTEHLSTFLPKEYLIIYIDEMFLDRNREDVDSEISKELDKVQILSTNYDYFRRMVIECTSYEDVKSTIRVCLRHRPDVLEISYLDNPEVARAIYDSGDLFSQHDYVLEIANTEYILVRRDCYFKQN